MKTARALKPRPGNQFWGIYHADREFARELGDPIRTVVQAPSKLVAEETAIRIGFSNPCAYPITAEEAKRHQELSRKLSRCLRV